MTQPLQTDSLEVTQADRDAWEQFGPAIFYGDMTGPEALARYRATALADMQRRVEVFRQIGRWEMAWEIAFQLEQPLIDCTEGKPEQASFDKAAKLAAASIAAKAGRAFSDLPLEVQFGDGEWTKVIEEARQALSDKTQGKDK